MISSLIRRILAAYVFLYRRTGGKLGGNLLVVRVLLLITTGRRTGLARTTPLGYVEYGGGYILVGLFVIFGSPTLGWLLNLKANPRATIQGRDRHMKVAAEIVGL